MNTKHTPGPVFAGNLRLGSIQQTPRGFRFITPIPGRRGSRKFYASIDECIPSWVKSLIAKAQGEVMK